MSYLTLEGKSEWHEWLEAKLSGCQRAEDRAAADTSSCLEAQSSQRQRTQMLCTLPRKSAHFIRKKSAAEWPMIKAVIESSVIFCFFFSKNGGNSENWLRAFIIYISFPVLYSEQKVRFLRFWWQEEVICKFVNLDAKCSHLNHKKGSRREHTVFSLTQILSLFFL